MTTDASKGSWSTIIFLASPGPSRSVLMTAPLLKIGVLACNRYVHTRDIWGPLMQPEALKRPDPTKTRMTGMVITHVWDVDPEGVGAFSRTYHGVEVVDDYGDMVGKVDGVILDDFDSCLHYKHLARPYLEAGTPVFINRPFALSLEDAREIIDLARAHDAPIMSGSSYEFAPEVASIKERIASIAPLTGYVAAGPMSD